VTSNASLSDCMATAGTLNVPAVLFSVFTR
jgi:hypothetical protein